MRSSAFIFVGSAALTAASAAILLAACGGGSSAMSPVPNPSSTPPPRGCSQTVLGTLAVRRVAPIGRFAVRPPARETDPSFDVVPGVVAVRFASHDARQLAAAASQIRGSVRTALDAGGAGTIALPRGLDPATAAQTLRAMPGVVSSDPVVLRRLQTQVIPNDPVFGTLPYDVTNPTVSNPAIQWDMYVMNMPTAWGQATGFGSSGVKVAIIDTGYDKNNPDLNGRVAQSIVFDLGNGQPDNTANIQDGDGHGTDVSGIAAADTNNGTDAAGVAGNVTLLEARVFPTPSAGNPNPSASSEDVAAAITWAVNNGAKVISMSLGSSTPDNTFEEPAVANAIAHDVTVVAAAGNGNAQGGQPTLDYPAHDPGVIAVGATSMCDGASPRNYGAAYEYVASYSNYLPNPTSGQYFVVAPGGDPSPNQVNCQSPACIDYLQWIINLYSTTAFQFPGQLVLIAGTSQATPHIAGLAALMLSKNPALSNTQIAQIVSTSAVNINDSRQGHGRVDANAALLLVP
jgi:thermitase